MSNDSGYISGEGMNLPTARRLDTGVDRPYVGTVGPLRECTPELRALLRRSIPEIDDADLEERRKTFVDRTDGTEYKIILSVVDPSNPKEARISAFCVRDGYTCYLRPIDSLEDVKVIGGGTFSGGRV